MNVRGYRVVEVFVASKEPPKPEAPNAPASNPQPALPPPAAVPVTSHVSGAPIYALLILLALVLGALAFKGCEQSRTGPQHETGPDVSDEAPPRIAVGPALDPPSAEIGPRDADVRYVLGAPPFPKVHRGPASAGDIP